MLSYIKRKLRELDATRIVEMLPVSEMRKIRIHRKQLYRRIDEAATYDDHEYLRYIDAEIGPHIDTLDERESLLVTRKLTATASRLGVPVPTDTGGLRVYWIDIFDGDNAVLSEKGVRQLKEDIRAELKWRRESRNHWMGYIGMIAGAIGAAAALATVLHDISKKDDPPACIISVDSHGVTSMMPPAKSQ